MVWSVAGDLPKPHPLLAMLEDAAGGRFPAVDGGIELMPSDADGTEAIVEFTGHSVILSDSLTTAELEAVGADGYGGATHPDVQRLIAGTDGHVGCLDVVLVGPGNGAGLPDGVVERTDLTDHPRVRRSHRHRRDCRVFANDDGVIIVGAGVVGRREVSVELFDPVTGSRGAGRALIAAALDAAPRGEVLWAQVSPGNAASLRAFLACGFVPVCSEILIHRAMDAGWTR